MTCPVCGEALQPADHVGLRCPRGHAFDRAREGYINLLAAAPGGGDTLEMVRARRAFLERGYYAPLGDAVIEMTMATRAGVASDGGPRADGPRADGPRASGGDPDPGQVDDAGDRAPLTILDAGCGEGYYIGRLHEALGREVTGRAYRCFGLDISRAAIRRAARRHREVTFVVADLWRGLPFASGSIDVLWDVFAPRNPGEFARVVAPGGVLLVVIPGPAHLVELRERLGLIGIEADKREHVIAQLAGPFVLAETRAIEYTLALGGPELRALATMTPSYWHLSAERREALITLEATEATASFVLLAFRRQR